MRCIDRIIGLAIALYLLCATPLEAATPAPAQHAGVQAGFTADGHPYLGTPAAPVTLEEWSDYLCPFCKRHVERTVPDLVDRYVRAGKLRIVFRDFPIDSLHPTSARGHVFARCAGAAGPAAYWTLHDAMFERQQQWASLPDPTGYLTELAGTLGLDVAGVRKCLQEDAAAEAVKKSVAEGQSLGINGTPSFRFRAAGSDTVHALSGAQPIERFAAVIDALLAGKAPPEEPKPPAPELPAWAKPEGLAPDPGRPGYTAAGDAFRGNPAAKVTVIEFTDFECPACRRHAREVQPKLDEALVDTGRVRWVSKHLPLRSHPHALLAAVAAECAGEQGRYWQFHDMLFETVEEWAVDAQEARLPQIAARAGLDPRAFQHCLEGRRALERVVADIYDAQGVIDRVPRFVILTGGPSGTVTGPLEAAQFIELIDGIIDPKPLPGES